MTAPGLARGLFAAAALIAWASLIVQLVLMLTGGAASGRTAAQTVWQFVGYYTILANLAAAVTGSLLALGRPVRPLMVYAVAATIAFVGLTYTLLLRWTWQPQGLQAVVDHGFHDAVPLLFVAGWLLSAKPPVRWSDVPWAILPPCLYSLYALLRGAVDGWYAYYFFDPSQQSAWMMALSFCGLAVTGLLVGAGLVWADRRLSRRRLA